MKRSILIAFAVLTFTVFTPKAHALFGNAEKQRQINRLENQLQQQQRKTGNWQAVSFVLGIGCVSATVIGCAIGSKARRHAKRASE